MAMLVTLCWGLQSAVDPGFTKGGGHKIMVRVVFTTTHLYKTLGRARDPRANGAWLSKLT